MVNRIVNPFWSFIKNHYNRTDSYEFYNVDTKKFEILSYTEPLKHIIFSDVITVGILYYILHHL